MLATLIACGFLGLSACSTAPEPSTEQAVSSVRIAAAADLKFALEEVKTQLEHERPEIDLVITYGSSGTFLQQISNGAPFDLFLSADINYPQQLVDQGLAQADDLFPYAVGRLVVWAPHDSPADPAMGLAGLARPEVAKVAIANPEHAPYGVAAVAAMESTGVFDDLKDKLVLGENVAQAAEFAASGNAQAGVIALSLALSPALLAAGDFSEVPLDAYPRLEQGGVVTGAAQDPAAARVVRDYLMGAEGRQILEGFGFSMPTSE